MVVFDVFGISTINAGTVNRIKSFKTFEQGVTRLILLQIEEGREDLLRCYTN